MTVGELLRADKSILEVKWLSPKSIEHLNERVSILLEDVDGHAEKWSSKPAVVYEDLLPRGLPDAVRALSIGRLNFHVSTYNTLIKADVTSIGQLYDAKVDDSLTKIAGLGPDSRQVIATRLSKLLDTTNVGNQIDWVQYCTEIGIRTFPVGYQGGHSFQEILEDLPQVIKNAIGDDERVWTIIQRRFGLQGRRKMKLDDLSDVFGGLTRERIRQLERKGLHELNQVLVHQNYSGKSYQIHPEISTAVQKLYNVLGQTPETMILETDLLHQIEQELGVKSHEIKPVLTLLFSDLWF